MLVDSTNLPPDKVHVNVAHLALILARKVPRALPLAYLCVALEHTLPLVLCLVLSVLVILILGNPQLQGSRTAKLVLLTPSPINLQPQDLDSVEVCNILYFIITQS